MIATSNSKSYPYETFRSYATEYDGLLSYSLATKRQNRFKKQRSVIKMVATMGTAFLLSGYLLTQYQSEQKPVGTQGRMRVGDLDEQISEASIDIKTTIPLGSNLTETERSFLTSINSEKLKEYLEKYASVPHSAGTRQDFVTAIYTANEMESFGIHAEIKEYYTLLSVPEHQHVSIKSPPRSARVLNLNELPVKGDACTSNEDALPPFLAYSASGNITAPVVYVNYGREEDFQLLLEKHIDLKGKIALVRYGKNFRGLKIMAAESHGMAGVLIYSDPADDGASNGKVYPEGSWRPVDSFQRGSAQYLSLYGGDPLTPGYASTLDAPHLSIKQATSIPHIPATVLSSRQASYLLEALSGSEIPFDEWQGDVLTVKYHLGDDFGTIVNMDLKITNSIGPIWNVIGTIEGYKAPDEHVYIGNHRDAWVCGAVDPSSGSAALLEIARSFGKLLQNGWKPRRTIKFASWDGEEYGLLGSTEFVEEFSKELSKKVVSYINVDNIKGNLVGANASPSIAQFIEDTARDVPSMKSFSQFPNLFEQWKFQKNNPKSKVTANIPESIDDKDHVIELLGSGTDYTAFSAHLGIVSANLRLNLDTKPYGVYHSTMDSVAYLENFADPNFESMSTMSKWWGLMTLRMADAPLIPLEFDSYARVMSKFVEEYQAQAYQFGIKLDFEPLIDAISEFNAHAELFHARLSQIDLTASDSKAILSKWNGKLIEMERKLLSEKGLPHRKWYKHVVFGPGFFEGYAGVAFPGLSDGIVAFNDSDKLIQEHIFELAQVVKNAADHLASP